jgi:predicted phosphodiesterase
LKNFSDCFYHPLIQKEYPLAFNKQCIPYLFKDTGLQFLALNSSWEIDEFFPKRSSINHSALSNGLWDADSQISQIPKELRLQRTTLRIAIFHHPVTGNESIQDCGFLEQLQKAGVVLCLNGHVHEERTDLVGYKHLRQMHVIGAGSFAAPKDSRPESIPRLYNVLQIDRGHHNLTVHTRCLRKDTGAWTGWAVWPKLGSDGFFPYYTVNLKELVQR